jgi:hypothetical protein
MAPTEPTFITPKRARKINAGKTGEFAKIKHMLNTINNDPKMAG